MDAGVFASKFCELGMNVNKMRDRRDRARPVFSNIRRTRSSNLENIASFQIAGKLVNAGVLASKFSRNIFPQIIIVGSTNI